MSKELRRRVERLEKEAGIEEELVTIDFMGGPPFTMPAREFDALLRKIWSTPDQPVKEGNERY